MKLKTICEDPDLQTLYIGGNFGGSVIVPGFCSVYLVQALWYAGPHTYRFMASPTLVDDNMFVQD